MCLLSYQNGVNAEKLYLVCLGFGGRLLSASLTPPSVVLFWSFGVAGKPLRLPVLLRPALNSSAFSTCVIWFLSHVGAGFSRSDGWLSWNLR